jgi:hypothetical protein
MEEPHHIGPFNSSDEFFMKELTKSWSPNYSEVTGSSSHAHLNQLGMWKILNIIFSSPPFTRSVEHDAEGDAALKESFVLRHDDLDLFNILCAEDGTVTGILDWDGVMAVPRCIGATSMPPFLSRDWLPDYTLWDMPQLLCRLEHYRNMYAKAMAEHTNDHRYTRKSPIYQAAFAFLYEDANPQDMVSKLLAEIPEFKRVKPSELLWRVGAGYPAAEKVLEAKIRELLEPDV